MDIFGEYIPNKILTNFYLIDYVKKLDIPNFREVFMGDTTPKSVFLLKALVSEHWSFQHVLNYLNDGYSQSSRKPSKT